MDLVKIFGEELATQIKEKLGEDYLIIDKKAGDFIPKEKFNEKIAESKTLKEQLESLNTKIQDLDKFTSENNELKNELAKIKTESDTYKSEFEKKMANEKKRFLLRENLIKTGVKELYLEDVERRFDLERLEIDNDKIIGFNDKLNPLKETYKEYFTETKFSGTGDPEKGIIPKGDFITEEQFNKMNALDRAKNIELINKSSIKWSQK